MFWGGFKGLNPFSGGTWTLRVYISSSQTSETSAGHPAAVEVRRKLPLEGLSALTPEDRGLCTGEVNGSSVCLGWGVSFISCIVIIIILIFVLSIIFLNDENMFL